MTQIHLDPGRDGLDGFPAGYTVVGRDSLGDVLALDGKGKVWAFAHGAGDWQRRSAAFASMDLLHEHIAFQAQLAPPPDDADLVALRAGRLAIERFVKGRKGAPYSRAAAMSALETLRESIEDRRSSQSKSGRGLAACQSLALRCEQALREAGATGEWLCRAAAPDGSVLGVMGGFTPPWTEQRVRELLAPLLGRIALQLFVRPKPKSGA